MLQVAVHHEADDGVEGEVRRHASIAIGVQWQSALPQEHEEAVDEPQRIDGEQGTQVLFPVHLAVRFHTGELVDAAFQWQQEVAPVIFSLVDACDVASQGDG